MRLKTPHWPDGKMISRFSPSSIIFPGIREILKSVVKFFRSFHPGTGPGAAGQVVIDNCRSTERHARQGQFMKDGTGQRVVIDIYGGATPVEP
jgi:hypothetical protein